MPKTNYLSNKVLDHITDKSEYTPPEVLYVGLFTAIPSPSGGGTEVSGGSYSRRAVSFSTATDGIISNTATITFPTATADWGTIVAIGIFDTATSGNLLCYDYLSQSRTVLLGDTLYFNVGELTWEES